MPRAQVKRHHVEELLPQAETEEPSTPMAAKAPKPTVKVVKPKPQKRVCIRTFKEMLWQLLDELEKHRNTHVDKDLQKEIEVYKARRNHTETLFENFIGSMTDIWDS